jgi:hypothetical protein
MLRRFDLQRSERGATRPGVLDVITALILLAILLWASWKQFPAYQRNLQSNLAPPVGRLQSSPSKTN